MAGKRQLLLELLASDKTGPATKGAAENLDKVALSAEEAAKATDNLGEQAGQTKEEVERFGKSNKSAAEHAEALKLEIESVEHELHQLAIAFAEAETAADRADYSKAIRKTQSDLRKLNKSKGLIEDLVPSPAAVEQGLDKLAPTFGAKLKELWSTAGESAGPALGIAAAVAAPFVGAAISGAVIGGAGLGGIVGGLLLVSKNPQVTSALDAFKKQTSARLKDAATPFVPVALGGIHAIDQALKGIDFKGIFADAAKFSGPLIGGIAHLISSLGSGITDLIHNAGPAVKAIGDGIGEIGSAIGDGFSELSKDGQQGADALRDLFTVIDGGIRITFGLIDGLTRIYGALERINSLTGGNIIDLVQKWQDYHQSISGAAQATYDQAAAAAQGASKNKQLAAAADAAAAAARGEKSALVGVADAIRAQTDPVFAVVNAQKELTTATDAYNGAVKKHGKNSEAAKLADQQLATAALDLEGNVGKLGNSFSGKLTPQMLATFRAAHLTSGQIAGIAKQFAIAKQRGDAFAKTYTANVNVRENFVKTGKPVSSLQATGPFSYVGHAEGGPVQKGRTYLVGEKRPELFVPDRDGTIIPSLDQMGGSGGGGEHRLVIDVRGADTELGRLFMKLLRTQPGFATTVRKYVTG